MPGSLKDFVEASNLLIAMFDNKMNYICCSDSWQMSFLGQTINSGDNHYELFPDIPRHWIDAHQSAMNGNLVRGLEERFKFPNGSERWMRWQVCPWHLDNKDVGGIIISAEDITSQKEIEIELRCVLTRFELVQQAAKIGVWDWNIEKSETILNAEYFEIYGVSPDENFTYDDFLSCIDHRDRKQVHELTQLALNGFGEIDFECRIVRKNDQAERWIKSKGRVDFFDGRAVRAYGALYDITEQKLSSLDYLKIESLDYKNIYDSLHEGIWIIDNNAITTYVNFAMAKMLGYSPTEILGHSLFSVIDKEWKDVAITKFSQRSQGSFDRHEFKFRRKDGSDCWVLLSAKPIFKNETFIGAIAIVMDCSEHQTFASSMSNPLCA